MLPTVRLEKHPRPASATWSSASTLNVEQLVVDQPPTIHLQHAKGVQEDQSELGLSKTHGRGVASDLNREDLQHGLGTRFSR